MSEVQVTTDTGAEMTFWEFLDEYSLEIPKVQRDYVQGRHTDHAKKVREDLVADMKSALGDGNNLPLNLGFIYGKVSNQKLLPLDGQQRLTLLFLVHIIAFANDATATDRLRKFSYETRHSSKRFIEELITYRNEVIFGKPSENILDAAWFQDEWEFDPTVQSMLIVLDLLHLELSTLSDLAQKLTEKRKINFLFLPMENLGLEDSLYIKLNARGRPLTDWENYKAELVSYAQQILSDEKDKAFLDEFKSNLDGTWTDLFWKISRDNFDEAFKRFFDVQTQNFQKQGLGQFGIAEFYAVAHCLNFFAGDKTSDASLQVLKNCVIGKNTYMDKVLLHAMTVYLSASHGEADDSFNSWFRIFRNLAVNSVLERESDYHRACQSITTQRERHNSLLVDLADGTADISGFRSEQIKEERLKAKLIQRGGDWMIAVHEAEKHAYFSGNIAGILAFSGISDDSIGNDDVGALQQMLTKLKDFTERMEALFSSSNLQCKPLLFRRALLSIGDYLIQTGQNWSFCSDTPASSSTWNWKTLLRSEQYSDKRNHFKALLDQLDFKLVLNAQLQKIINDATISDSDWRYYFVKYEQFMGYLGREHWSIRWNDDWRQIALLKQKQLSGQWHCAGILALSIALKAKNIQHKYHFHYGYWWRDQWYLNELVGHPTCKRIRFDCNKKKFISEFENHAVESETIAEVSSLFGL